MTDEELLYVYQQGVTLSTNNEVSSIIEALELIIAEELNTFGKSEYIKVLSEQ